jgi:hypothetical protein
MVIQSNRDKLAYLLREKELVNNKIQELLDYSNDHTLSDKAQTWLDRSGDYLKQINFEINRLKAVTI